MILKKALTVFAIPIARFEIGHTPQKLPDIPSATFCFLAYLLTVWYTLCTQRKLLYHTFPDNATLFSKKCHKYCKFFINKNNVLIIQRQ